MLGRMSQERSAFWRKDRTMQMGVQIQTQSCRTSYQVQSSHLSSWRSYDRRRRELCTGEQLEQHSCVPSSIDDAKLGNHFSRLEQRIHSSGFDLDIEGKFAEYLGVGIEECPDGTRIMTQKGLIDKIIKSTKMQECNPTWTPSPQAALGSDPDGEPHDENEWKYASIVGMLLYVSNNTRPDITFAVSQVARFTAAPKKSHAKAIRTIVRYLAKTKDKGIIVKPNGTYDLETWVDADFAGLHGREPPDDRNNVRSRMGYIITFGGIPLIWRSQLISEICNSTLHAEYVALANALRTLIPIRALLKDTLEFFDIKSKSPMLFSKVWEDNNGALSLATTQKPTTHTKYFDVKLHFFWSYVYNEECNPDGWLHLDKCSTDLMNADYLTKGLGRQKFEENRRRTQGW